jgi:hypothetical protein
MMKKRIKPLLLFLLAGIALACGADDCTIVEIPDYLKDLENLIIVQPNSEPVYEIDFIQTAEIEHSSATDNWFVDWSDEFWAFSGGDYWFAGIEVDDSGRIYVGNRAAHTIQVFDADGLFLTEKGGEGRGPGEFNGISDIKIQDNQLLAI